MMNSEKPKYVTWKRLDSGEMDLISFNLSDAGDEVIFELKRLGSIYPEMNDGIERLQAEFLQAVVTPSDSPSGLLARWADSNASKLSEGEYQNFLKLVDELNRIS